MQIWYGMRALRVRFMVTRGGPQRGRRGSKKNADRQRIRLVGGTTVQRQYLGRGLTEGESRGEG